MFKKIDLKQISKFLNINRKLLTLNSYGINT